MLVAGVNEERLLLSAVEFSERRAVLSLLSEFVLVRVYPHGSMHGIRHSMCTMPVPVFFFFVCV